MSSYQRPAFWRVPHNRVDPDNRPQVSDVQPGSPAYHELQRGDIITKIEDYDGRDLRHVDAQNLFKNASTNIKLVIERDTAGQRAPSALSNGNSRCSSAVPTFCSPPPTYHDTNQSNGLVAPSNLPYRTTSPNLPGPDAYHNALMSPVDSLPHTVFPTLTDGAYHKTASFNNSPRPLSREYHHELEEETEAITNQPYRTTPLVLPGAKVKKDSAPTESYLRHHPNPAMRASPHSYYDHQDVLMKQKVADTVLHRVGGDDIANKVVHKQFNSPIGLYSDANIAHTIHNTTGTVPLNGSLPQKTKSYKRTLLYDPAKSETYRALQEESYGDSVQEVTVPVQTRVFQPNRIVPGKKPLPNHQPPQPQPNTFVNSLGDSGENIHQSGSFKRLMFHVLGETDY